MTSKAPNKDLGETGGPEVAESKSDVTGTLEDKDVDTKPAESKESKSEGMDLAAVAARRAKQVQFILFCMWLDDVVDPRPNSRGSFTSDSVVFAGQGGETGMGPYRRKGRRGDGASCHCSCAAHWRCASCSHVLAVPQEDAEEDELDGLLDFARNLGISFSLFPSLCIMSRPCTRNTLHASLFQTSINTWEIWRSLR